MIDAQPTLRSMVSDCPQPTAVPRVTIGMPTYNSARTLRSAVDALLAQTYSDFELIISDNASTDDTWSIIGEYARCDRRVVPMRQTQNIGANGNYTAVFIAARGRYFKWASSNDWCAPDFLEKCVVHLDAHPMTALVAPRTRIFQDDPTTGRDYEHDVAFDADDAVDRFIQVWTRIALNNVINGVGRTEILRRTRLIEHYPGADVVLLSHLALLGKIQLLPDRLYYRQMDQSTATPLMSKEAVHRHHYPQRTARALFPSWRSVTGRASAVLASGLSFGDTRRALMWVLQTAYWRRESLWGDIEDAVRYAIQRIAHRSRLCPPTGDK